MSKTYSAKPLEVERTWWLVDAEGLTLGRVASVVATLLRGKHKPQYTPNVDTGDFVVVINADKIKVSGAKATDKQYYWHSHFKGGLKSASFKEMQERHPGRVVERAVWGMLPHTSLGRKQKTKLSVYAGSEHPHAAQKPVPCKELLEAAH